jgi:hypothetical protein
MSQARQELNESRARYEKGLELYKQGKVSIDTSGYGLFRVNEYLVDTQKVKCGCPDFMNRKKPCKHFYAASIFQRNGCKVARPGNVSTEEKPKSESNPSPKVDEGKKDGVNQKSKSGATYKFYDKQDVVTRLAVLHAATKILKTHRRPIELKEVFEIAKKLEAWALGEEP